jgi:hypothetical protein
MKTFLIEDFFHLLLRISPRIFEKNRNDPDDIIGAWDTDPCRKSEVENFVALSL